MITLGLFTLKRARGLRGIAHRRPATSHHAHASTSLLRRMRAGQPAIVFAVMLAAAALLLPPAVSAAPALVAAPSADISCDQTPFGRRLTLGGDMEVVDLVQYNGAPDAELLREWNLSANAGPGAPPLQQSLAEYWHYYHGATGDLLQALPVDLDGDGRDEIVIATESPGNQLTLGVFRRQPYYGTDIDLFSTWHLTAPFSQVQLVAGDLDGSQDGRQELAVLVTDAGSQGSMTAYILTGDDEGGIAQADGIAAGTWHWAPSSGAIVIGASAIAAGRLFLNGREQLVVLAETYASGSASSTRQLGYHVLEYQSTTPALHVKSGDTNVASREPFLMLVDGAFDTANGGADIKKIERLDLELGDVAGTMADEMVLHAGFETSGGNGSLYQVVQFLQHFRLVHDGNGQVTQIVMPTRANGDMFDSSQLVSNHEYLPDTWDAVVGNIDDSIKKEIVVARNVFADGALQVDVYKASTELTAAFSYFRSDTTVQFHDDSVGFPGPIDAGTPRWNFGDGQTSNVRNPNHQFPGPGTYHVTLSVAQTVTTADGPVHYTDSYTLPIVVDSGTSSGGELDLSHTMMQVLPSPTFAAAYQSGNLLHFGPVRVVLGDMDRDGRPEIVTLARKGSGSAQGEGLLRSVWNVQYDEPAPPTLVGRHMLEQAGTDTPIDQLAVLALLSVDFDGDSVEATIGADCRAVTESKIHQVIWAPPYFERLQANTDRTASFGRSTSNGESLESRYGSYTSSAISGYVGVDLGVDLLGILGGSASLRTTAERFHQAADGTVAGKERSFAVTEGFTQPGADGLVTVETNTFYCYSYDVSQADVGLDPDSALRICEIHDPENSTSRAPMSPGYWNREFPRAWAQASGGNPPPNWVPVTRDWASIALFKPVTSNAGFLPGAGLQLLTDGRFTTHVESQSRNQPYLEIDLGSVRAITNIRVFGPDDQPTADLTGFRVYTSTTPMPTAGLPAGPGVQMFAPDNFAGIIRARWNIWTWLDNPGMSTGSEPLLARYIRLQSPATARLNVAEIQVFGDVHQDPPRYPAAICDPHLHDGLFEAKLWDASTAAFRAVEVHGDLLWLGTGPASGPSWGADGPYLQGCQNDAELMASNRNFSILDNVAIGYPGVTQWSYASEAGTSAGTTRSFESSTSVGAEFEASLSLGASFVAGGSTQFSSGVTRDYQSITFWREGLDMGGSVGGFDAPYNTAEYVNACKYNARPYAYRQVDQSSTGYRHTMYVVDYVVPQDVGGTAWSRGQLPQQCRSLPDAGDIIFQSGFES